MIRVGIFRKLWVGEWTQKWIDVFYSVTIAAIKQIPLGRSANTGMLHPTKRAKHAVAWHVDWLVGRSVGRSRITDESTQFRSTVRDLLSHLSARAPSASVSSRQSLATTTRNLLPPWLLPLPPSIGTVPFGPPPGSVSVGLYRWQWRQWKGRVAEPFPRLPHRPCATSCDGNLCRNETIVLPSLLPSPNERRPPRGPLRRPIINFHSGNMFACFEISFPIVAITADCWSSDEKGNHPTHVRSKNSCARIDSIFIRYSFKLCMLWRYARKIQI